MEPLMPAQWKDYKHASSCHICIKPFKEGNRKVRDHCHYSGIYRGAAHSLCNLQYKIPSYIPVLFHNLSGYDAHLFIKGLTASMSGGAHMGVITKNKEDYITFSMSVEVYKYIDKDEEERSKEIELRFIDSFKFMTSSLDSKACLKKTTIRLELLLDPDMLLMFERGIREGITQSVYRWAKANNPYMGSEYAL